MGRIYYGGSETPITIADAALAHLKVVATTKLRRSEGFTVTWHHPSAAHAGRTTLWLHPAIALRFEFDGAEPVALRREWIEELANAANSAGGIQLSAEQVIDDPERA